MKNLIKILTIAISLFFAVFFSYAAMSKAAGFKNFRDQLDQSPGLHGNGAVAAFGIIALQALASILLCYRPSRSWGFWMVFGMLSVYAGYTAVILIESKKHPSTCIGLFEKMSWEENLILNIGLLVTALAGIITLRRRDHQLKL